MRADGTNLADMEQLLRSLSQAEDHDFRTLLLELHPTDRMEVYVKADESLKNRIHAHTTPEQFAEIFQSLNVEEQRRSLDKLERRYAADMLRHMYADDAAAFLSELTGEESAALLKLMGQEDARDVQSIMGYKDDSAGSIMTTEFISVSAEDTVQQVFQQLRSKAEQAETIYYLYVVDESDRLAGVVSLRDLIIAKGERKVKELMNRQIIQVNVDTDQEEVAAAIKKYDFLAVPVVESNGKLVGIVTVDDVMDVLDEETNEDFGEMSAMKGVANLDMSAVESTRKRLPWLIILLFIGMLTAGIIGRFEDTLEEVAILAVFIPLIADMAGNTGTQSLALVVRGLALGKFDRPRIWRLLKREAATGVMMGLACGLLVTLISQFVTKGNIVLGFIVGFSLFCTLIIASLAGTIVPILINRLRIDPAVASGPFITTINDIIGLLIYFSIATALLQYL